MKKPLYYFGIPLWLLIAGPSLIIALLLGFYQTKLDAQETVPQTQTILKSYFVTGNRPSQTNYWEMIDTFFWYVNQTYTNAVAAQQSAASVQNFYNAFANATITVSSNVTVSITNAVNVSSITFLNASIGPGILIPGHGGQSWWYFNFQMNFTQPLLGSNYNVFVSSPGTMRTNSPYSWTQFGTIPALDVPTGDNIVKSNTCVQFAVFAGDQNTNILNGLNLSIFVQ